MDLQEETWQNESNKSDGYSYRMCVGSTYDNQTTLINCNPSSLVDINPLLDTIHSIFPAYDKNR